MILLGPDAGTVYQYDPGSGQAQVVFSNTPPQLTSLAGIVVDGLGRTLLVEPASVGSPAGRIYLQNGQQLTLLAHTAGGVGAAIDPLTGHLFVTQQGHPGESGGEILQVDAFSSPAAYGSYRGAGYFTFGVGPEDGGISFDAAGNFFVAAGLEGRIVKVDRASGTRSVFATGFDHPISVAVGTGTPGVAGAQGTSLFVLDGAAVYERGIGGLPAGPPPATPPGLAPGASLRVQGIISPNATIPVVLDSPADAGRLYLVFPGLLGKEPGFPLSMAFLNEDRVVPNNPDFALWGLVNSDIFPAFLGNLDASGRSEPAMAFHLPNAPELMDLHLFLELAWITFDPSAYNGVSTIGGTAHVYIGP
jgi:hypothetical protein